MWKILTTTFSTLAQNVPQTQTIQTNRKIVITKLSLAGASTTTFADTTYLKVKIDDTELFNNFVPTSALKGDNGNGYPLPMALEIEAKKTITVEAKNTDGSSITTYVVAFHGYEPK